MNNKWRELQNKIGALDWRVLAAEIGIIAAIVACVTGYLIWRYPDILQAFQSVESFDLFLERHRDSSVMLYIVIQALQVIVAVIPGQIVQIAGGYIYGFWYASLWSLIGLAAGSTISFYLARFIGQQPIRRIYGGEMVDKYTALLSSRNAFAIMLFLYIFPGFPKDVLAFFAGLSNMKFSRFLPMATIARYPAMALSMLIGSTMGVRSYKATAVLVLACVLCAGICYIFRNQLLALSDRYFGFSQERQELHLK
ncbi:MAG: TVP38/TMEM64 family protein [Firmicutes bacterium]|nr:TVP38/TMEM64 family protein [Bacillota bacterium]